jgi:GNAT superfamily N-acetyltransferase
MDGSSTREIELPDGTVMVVRPVTEPDVPGLAALYAGLSPDDLRRRFFSVYHPSTEFFTRIARGEGGRVGLVAVVPDPDDDSDTRGRVVAEAHYAPLPDGDAEFAITVAPDWRGWLGPYLLDALADTAAEHGVPNLQAEVLLENSPMLAVVRARGYATLDHTDYSVVRVTIGATSRTPSWPGSHERPRVLAEVPGGRWRSEAAARADGFEVIVCPGPARGPRSHCPLLAGERCPLADGADAVVFALRPDDRRSGEVLAGLRQLHPGVPVCVQQNAAPEGSGDAVVRADAPTDEVLAILRRLTGRPAPTTPTTPASTPPASTPPAVTEPASTADGR